MKNSTNSNHNKHSSPANIGLAILSLIITIVLFQYMNNYNYERYVFNKKTKDFIYQKMDKDHNIISQNRIPFDDILAIQNIMSDIEGEKYYSFEINLILKDYTRIHITSNNSDIDTDIQSSFISKITGKEIVKHAYKN